MDRRVALLRPSVEDIVDLLFAAEEASQRIVQLVWYLVGRDPLTRPLLAELQALARDARIEIGSQQWMLSALDLNQQVDKLISADGRTWKHVEDVLDPYGDIGVDYPSLIIIFDARIARAQGDRSRLRHLRARILRDAARHPSSPFTSVPQDARTFPPKRRKPRVPTSATSGRTIERPTPAVQVMRASRQDNVPSDPKKVKPHQ